MSDWKVSDEDFWTLETGNDVNEQEELADLAEGYEGYLALDFQWYAQQVADRIYNIHQDRGVAETFIFSLTCNSEGEIDGGEVALSLPSTSIYLMISLEWKHMTNDRGAKGHEGLLAIKDCLMDEYAQLRRFAVKSNLVTQ